ncbi:MAG: hypothetical protein ACRDND_14015 [Streptosporangiaceae bacterium]
MRIGVVFPQTEIGPDAGAVRSYGQRVEELGFRHVMAYDHVVGADPAVHQGWTAPTTCTPRSTSTRRSGRTFAPGAGASRNRSR